MKTLNNITEIIANQLGGIARELLDDPNNSEFFGDYDVIVCSERIFVEDYLPREEEYLEKNSEMLALNCSDPNEQPYRNKIFVVINMGSGQRNYAVSNSDCTIDVLSEENDFVFARALLDEFVAKYNFKYESGIVQAYFNPNVNSSMEEVYTGFRALFSVHGFVRVPEQGFAFISEVSISFDDNGTERTISIPFTNLSYTWASQPDPQAFAGTGGQTKALNRQSTTVVSFSTYFNFDDSVENLLYSAFSNKIIYVMNGHQNEKFHIKLLTPYERGSGDNKERIAIVDKWFVLVNAGYNQELGDIDPWTISFSESKETEI